MKLDPIEALDAYYEACRQVPPPTPRTPRTGDAAIPTLGLAAGIAAAWALAATPAAPNVQACRQTEAAIVQLQQATMQPRIVLTSDRGVSVRRARQA